MYNIYYGMVFPYRKSNKNIYFVSDSVDNDDDMEQFVLYNIDLYNQIFPMQ